MSVLVAVAIAIGVVLVPSYNLTVEEASAVPVNVGVLLLVIVPLSGLEMTGAAGAAVSEVLSVNVAIADAPVSSIARTVCGSADVVGTVNAAVKVPLEVVVTVVGVVVTGVPS